MRELLQQALKLLIAYQDYTRDSRIANKCGLTIQALEAELAKPEHWSDCAVYNEPAYPKGACDCGGYYKPIAYKEKNSDSIFYDKNNCNGEYIPLYTAPPRKEWVGLTNEELEEIQYSTDTQVEYITYDEGEYGMEIEIHPENFARAIEAKLKEKNDGNN